MNFKDVKSLKEFDDDNLYDVLCKGIHHPDDVSHLKDLFKDTTCLHYHLFDDSIFIEKRNKTEENPDGDNLLEYILPTIRRAYSKFFINPPAIFTASKENRRLELLRLQFNLIEFLNFLSNKFKKNQDSLNDFKNLDKDSEILTLIVEDYLASKISYIASLYATEIQTEIRDIKISKHLDI
jgi:hypothetical protein